MQDSELFVRLLFRVSRALSVKMNLLFLSEG